MSYLLGLRGPSLAVDTGQSSSLVAVHLACESLRRGERDLALAGGVNLNLLAEHAGAVGEFGALSPDGRCYTFDAGANGYVRGEGGGVVVLKPLSDALADGDRVYCVILGGAVNNDGAHATGLTVPSARRPGGGARGGLRAAPASSPADVQYVELHGTGTALGDPIEAAALGAALGADRRGRRRPLLVGSVKTNIGHLEGAAGIAGLIKTALSLWHRRLPASLNFDRRRTRHPAGRARPAGAAAPAAGRAGTPAGRRGQLLRHRRHQLPPGARRGSRAAAGPARPAGASPSRPLAWPLAWPVYGQSGAGLRAQAGQLHSYLAARPELRPADIGLSLAAAGHRSGTAA